MSTPTLPPLGGPDIPPMLDDYPGMSAALTKEIQEEFVRGIMEGMRLEMEEMAYATGEIDSNLSGVVEASRMLKDEAQGAVDEVLSLRFDEDAQRQAVLHLEEMGLSPEIIAGAVRNMAMMDGGPLRTNPTSASDEEAEANRQQIKNMAEGVKAGIMAAQEDTPEGTVQPSLFAPPPPTTAKQGMLPGMDKVKHVPGPFDDVIDTGEVGPGSMPGREGYPAGAAAGKPPSTADEKPPMTYREGVSLGSDFGSLRQAATNRVNQYANERLADAMPDKLPNGDWIDRSLGKAWERSQNRVGRVTGALDAIGGGEGIAGALGALSTTLARVLGPLGVAVGGHQLAQQGLAAQRQANLPYQQAFGGGQAEAYGQRLQETMFSRFDAFGTLGAGQGAQLFRNVSALGQQGDERERSMGFAMDMYRGGVDLDTSMRLIEIASDEGQDSLDDFSLSLRSLSEVAQESGVAVSHAHELYLKAINSARGIAVGESADQLASTVASIQTQQTSTGIGEIDIMSMAQDDKLLRRAAGAQGMDFGEFSAQVQAGEGEALSALFENSFGQLISNLPLDRASAETKALAAQLLKDGGGQLSADAAQEISAALQAEGIYDMTQVRAVGNALGIPRGTKDVTYHQWIARAFAGDPTVDVEPMIERQEQARETEDVTTWEGTSLRQEGLDLAGSNMDRATAARKDWGWKDEDSRWVFGGNLLGGDAQAVHDAGDLYLDQIMSGDRTERSLALESIYRQIGRQGEDESAEDVEARAADWAERQFEVIEDGEVTATFGIGELPNYTEQLESGKVRSVDAQGNVQALTDLVPGLAQHQKDPGQQEQVRLLSEISSTLSTQGIAVSVTARGDLAEFLTFGREGGVDVKSARDNGLPADGFNPGSFNPFYDSSGRRR